MELTNGDLTLRPPAEADTATVTSSVLASLAELSPWMPWATPAYTDENARAWINGETGDLHRFLMIDGSGRHVGSCGLNDVNDLNSTANLGYWVRSDASRRGYATTATRLLARFGLEHGGLNRIEIVMSVHNEASRRVAEKSGAHYEGRSREALLLLGVYHDIHRWSLIRSDL